MPLPTGGNTRTITGYAKVLLDYPRCTTCQFGDACRWLNLKHPAPSITDPLPELLSALDTAVTYLRTPEREHMAHDRHCDCDTCTWLRDAKSFLRQHRRPD